MKKVLGLTLVFLVGTQLAFSCTTFFINKNGQLAFGRNYDWITDVGMVCKNTRGLSKTSMQRSAGNTISWVSKYGSLTFNQYGKEFPTGGMNEKGLVVELMWLEGSIYPKADNRAEISVLQWIQYQLDNCASIDEVIETDKRIRIGAAGNPPLHYLVADASGKAATIEFLNGKMVVHKGNNLPFPVLTNTDYSTAYNQIKSSGSTSQINASSTFKDNSVQRFATACSMVQQFQANDIKQSVIDYSFDILKQVKQEGWTRWSIVYDLTNKTIHFKTARYAAIKSISFSDFDFNCNASPLSLNMNQPMQGKVSLQFKPYTTEVNKQLIETSVEESKTQVTISEMDRKRLIDYPALIKCQ